ncbi:PH and SEC7 domain-containing protein 4 [Anarrhichthys ocellatus]|uniref:PH and SEC7 domain-containing protein 4 n=1 Tax=Anarrhichthys ocellatus TaxID=433405 RepID=UPI0012ED5CFF|nr:PH and SEC7 domain-containing protein 4-like [Anarrhichthys ocellatus]XP_031716003.1 PH and SEC7 domain-containing protein 4-like [Anarrhichthys ocellatus]XP_031716004.1 PH and SEC7 domain-containing protein 4-like [Anarrhichthys ocellatus]XP_031716005.1 PH and SEC7 domain-containing protein 4-like [Anarrhichthys ocellatus]XP_031716007.1 PH and SEC7 domain-containing protein 4-like [Anarrhichthys ocellatus]XP_031716008.1 PH and SEC7 domain-containing protein 4-like [Anarrhichthys ocellatus]
MLMEEENVCSSLPDVTDSVLQRPQQDSWTSIDHQYMNGEEEAVAWGDTVVQINQVHGTDPLSVSLEAGRETPEQVEQWEQVVWPMNCTSPPLSFATVQWDMPDPSAATPSFVTDGCLANEPSSGDVTSLHSTSPSLHQSRGVNLFTREGRGEEDKFDRLPLNSNLEWTGNGSEPCDAADVQEPPTQEREDPTHELLESNNDIPLRADLEEEEEEEGHSVTSYPVETVDLINILEGIDASEDEADSFVDLKLEEEQEEPDVLLTGQGDSEEEQTLANGVEDEGEEEDEQINVSYTDQSEEANIVSCLIDVEFPAEPLQTDDAGPTVNPDKLIDLQQSELLEERQHSGTEEDIEVLEQLHEDPTGQPAEPEMCEDVDQNIDPEQSEDNVEELSTRTAGDTERIENSPEIIELTEEPEETSCLEERGCDQHVELSPQLERAESEQLERAESEQLETTEELKEIQTEVSQDQLGQSQHLKQPAEMEPTEESTRRETADLPRDSTQSQQTVSVGVAELREQTEPSEQNEQTPQTTNSSLAGQLVQPETDESEIMEHLSPEPEVTQQTAEAEFNRVDEQAEKSHRGEEVGGCEDGSVRTIVANDEQPKAPETAAPHMNGDAVNREMARCLAERLYKLDGIQRVDVVKHLDKDNDFSRAVGEEYLKLFDFTGQTLDHALRSFLKVVVLIGETQERERVLQHFACRFHQCNPDSFTSSESVLALTCALMLLNTDLHGQNVGKSMSSVKFVSNLDGMNEGENFSKDLLKSLYNSIKSEPLQWAVDEEELKSSVLVDEDAREDAPLRSKANPFQDVPHDKTASVAKQGFLQRKLHADIDGKRTPWGKRGWKTFYGVVRGMVLYLQKDDYRRDQPIDEEVVSLHHSLADQAADYTKKPHVFRLQTADWRVLLFQASSKVEMYSWISRINLASALHSSPPFPAAVGSQRRFCRPILPSSQSAHTLDRQLQSYAGTLGSFKEDLSYLQQNLPEGKRARAKELEEHRVRAEYLQHEMCRYEIYIQGLEAWKSVKKTGGSVSSVADLKRFDKAVWADSLMEEDEVEGMLKKSYSSPSLELELAPPTVIKVRRNISERRTYRRTIIPRWNKEV